MILGVLLNEGKRKGRVGAGLGRGAGELETTGRIAWKETPRVNAPLDPEQKLDTPAAIGRDEVLPGGGIVEVDEGVEGAQPAGILLQAAHELLRRRPHSVVVRRVHPRR